MAQFLVTVSVEGLPDDSLHQYRHLHELPRTGEKFALSVGTFSVLDVVHQAEHPMPHVEIFIRIPSHLFAALKVNPAWGPPHKLLEIVRKGHQPRSSI